MKFCVKQPELLAVLDRVVAVATKGIRQNFEEQRRVHISCTADAATFITTNGYTDARFVIPVQGMEPGKAIAGAEILKNIVGTLGGANNADKVFCVELEKEILKVTDTSSKKKKNFATIETYPTSKVDFRFAKPTKPQVSYTFERATFDKIVKTVSRYAGKGYHKHFHMLVMHFRGDVSRFVAGDGSLFSIMEVATPQAPVDDTMYILPAVQASIVASATGRSSKITVSFQEHKGCYFEMDDGTDILVKGIPDEKYIDYSRHLVLKDEAKTVVDVLRSDFEHGIAVVESVKDAGQEGCHNVIFRASAASLELSVEEEKNTCDFSCSVNYYDFVQRDKFESRYVASLLKDVLACFPKEYLRFYCLEEKGIIIVEPVDLLETKDERNVPMIKETSDKSRVFFFFKTAKSKEA